MAMSVKATRFIGCDVGKSEIVVCDSTNDRITKLPNRPQALAAFAATLDGSCLVICEATGGYEVALLEALEAAGIAAHRADARKVKAFIRSYGTLGKSDGIDARGLMRYGQEREPRLTRWRAPTRVCIRLNLLVKARNDFVVERVAYRNRVAAPGAKVAARYLNATLRCLDQQIRAIEAEIKSLIREEPWLRDSVKALKAIVGIGDTTAHALVALMPELGHLTRRQAAALAGLAPHPRQSGATDGYRRTRGGRPELRAALFMAGLSAARHNPTLRAFYKRLIGTGKAKLVATIAVMRKLVILCNATLSTLRAKLQLAEGERPAVAST